MTFEERIRIFLAKLRSLPDFKKKIILWAVVIVLGLPMGYIWVTGTINSLSKARVAMPVIPLPEISMPALPALDILKTASPTSAQP